VVNASASCATQLRCSNTPLPGVYKHRLVDFFELVGLSPSQELVDVVVAAQQSQRHALAAELARRLHVGGQILVHDVSHGDALICSEAFMAPLCLQLGGMRSA